MGESSSYAYGRLLKMRSYTVQLKLKTVVITKIKSKEAGIIIIINFELACKVHNTYKYPIIIRSLISWSDKINLEIEAPAGYFSRKYGMQTLITPALF